MKFIAFYLNLVPLIAIFLVLVKMDADAHR